MKVYKPKFKNRQGEWQTGAFYWVRFSTAGKITRKSLRTKDKRVANMRAVQIVEKAERLASGMADPFEVHRDRPFKEHLDDFDGFLEHRAVSDSHKKDRMLCLRAYAEDNRVRTIADIDIVVVQAWLASLADGEDGLSARSVNKRFQALRQLGRWFVQTRRCAFNPFEGITARNEATDRRRVRRAFTEAELAALCKTARERPLERARINRKNKGVTSEQENKLRRLGETRAFLYAFAAGTGLRKGELAGLLWRDVNSDRSVLTVPAAVAKSRKKQELPLRRDLAADLERHAERLDGGDFDTGPKDRVFPGALFPTHHTFKADLVEAELDGEDDQGRVLDFHALRTTFITRLSVAGVHPRIAQALARHSRLDLTMRVYTDVHLLDLQAATDSTRPRQTPHGTAATTRRTAGA